MLNVCVNCGQVANEVPQGLYLMALTVPYPDYCTNISLPLLKMPHLLLLSCFAHNLVVPGKCHELLLKCFPWEPLQSQQKFLSAPGQITLKKKSANIDPTYISPILHKFPDLSL